MARRWYLNKEKRQIASNHCFRIEMVWLSVISGSCAWMHYYKWSSIYLFHVHFFLLFRWDIRFDTLFCRSGRLHFNPLSTLSVSHTSHAKPKNDDGKIGEKEREKEEKNINRLHYYLCRNDVGSIENRLGHNSAQITVNVLKFLHQLRYRIDVVPFEHGVRGVQLLNVCIMRIDVIS